jgi:hypothetical protein
VKTLGSASSLSEIEKQRSLELARDLSPSPPPLIIDEEPLGKILESEREKENLDTLFPLLIREKTNEDVVDNGLGGFGNGSDVDLQRDISAQDRDKNRGNKQISNAQTGGDDAKYNAANQGNKAQHLLGNWVDPNGEKMKKNKRKSRQPVRIIKKDPLPPPPPTQEKEKVNKSIYSNMSFENINERDPRQREALRHQKGKGKKVYTLGEIYDILWQDTLDY